MPFCSNCGQEIERQVKFCPGCGKPVAPETSGGGTQFEGKIHKCPNCGEPIDAFTTSCRTCGYEFRGVKASESVRIFPRSRIFMTGHRKRPQRRRPGGNKNE